MWSHKISLLFTSFTSKPLNSNILSYFASVLITSGFNLEKRNLNPSITSCVQCPGPAVQTPKHECGGGWKKPHRRDQRAARFVSAATASAMETANEAAEQGGHCRGSAWMGVCVESAFYLSPTESGLSGGGGHAPLSARRQRPGGRNPPTRQRFNSIRCRKSVTYLRQIWLKCWNLWV